MTITSFQRLVSNAGNAVAEAGPIDISSGTSAAIAATRFAVAIISTDNLGSVDGYTNEHISLTVGAAAVTKLYEVSNANGAPGAGVTVSTWLITHTANIPSGTAAMVTFAAPIVAKSIIGWVFNRDNTKYLDIAAATYRFDDASDIGSLTIDTGVASREHLFLLSIGVEAVVNAPTYDAGMTTIGTSGPVVDPSVRNTGAFQIATQAALTVDPTSSGVGLTADWAMSGIALFERTRDSMISEPPIIDDFNRANGVLTAGVVWSGTVIDAATATTLTIDTNVIRGTSLPTNNALSSFEIGPDFDLILDCAFANATSAFNPLAIMFAIAGGGTAGATFYRLTVTNSGSWDIERGTTGTGTTIAQATRGLLATSDRVRVSVRGQTINAYKMAVGTSIWVLQVSITDTGGYLPRAGRFAVQSLNTADSKWDNLRAASFTGSLPIIDNFNRADGALTGAAWSANKIISAAASTGVVINGSALTCSASGNIAGALVQGPNVEYQFDFVTAPDVNYGTNFYFLVTNPSTATYTGYIVQFYSTGSYVRMCTGTGTDTAITAKTVQAIGAGDSIWIMRRDTRIAVFYRASGSSNWIVLHDIIDSSWVQAGVFGFLWGTYPSAKIDNFRGGTLALPNKVIT